MKFKQNVIWHTEDEKPIRERYILFIKKDDPYPNPLTGYYKNSGAIEMSTNRLPGFERLTWDHIRFWTELSEFLNEIENAAYIEKAAHGVME